MPTELRTVGDVFREWFPGHPGCIGSDNGTACPMRMGLVAAGLLAPMDSEDGDALIVPLADGQQVVVEKGAWEAAVCRYAGYPTCNTREQARAVYGSKQADGSEFEEAWELAEAGAISVLSALFGKDGVVAADKAGVVSHFEGAINEACVVGLEDGHPGHRLVVVNVGDTIYIKRLEENKP